MSELFIDIEPLSPSRGTAVISHGLGEHCGRYTPLANFFRERDRGQGVKFGGSAWRGSERE